MKLIFNPDKDECKNAEDHNCPDNSVCHNTEGSFTCTCKPGYSQALDSNGDLTCDGKEGEEGGRGGREGGR